jgi:hypothetical protein
VEVVFSRELVQSSIGQIVSGYKMNVPEVQQEYGCSRNSSYERILLFITIIFALTFAKYEQHGITSPHGITSY